MDQLTTQRILNYSDDGTGDDLRSSLLYARRYQRLGYEETQVSVARLASYAVLDTAINRISIQKSLLYIVLEAQPYPNTQRIQELFNDRLRRTNTAPEDDEVDNGAPHIMLRFRLRNPTSTDAFWVRPPPIPQPPKGLRVLLAAPGPVEDMDSWRMPSRMLRRPDAYAAATGGTGNTTGYVPVVIM